MDYPTRMKCTHALLKRYAFPLWQWNPWKKGNRMLRWKVIQQSTRAVADFELCTGKNQANSTAQRLCMQLEAIHITFYPFPPHTLYMLATMLILLE